MFKKSLFVAFSMALVVGTCISAVLAQEKNTPTGTPLIWEPVTIAERDLYWGPGGRQMFPAMEGMRFVGRDAGGNNLKFRLEEKSGRVWIAKAADESQPEVAATRLLWAIGYPTEIDYIVPKVAVEKWGRFKNVRFEARPEGVKRGIRWSWDDNPFKQSNEFAGLRIMMAMLNNWDLKDENTVILQTDGKLYYTVSDLGSSFGKLAQHSRTRSGRSVNKPADYAGSTFIKTVDGNMIHFAYTGARADLMQGINVTHGRWLADLLMQLSDKQIEDAFRAANYEPEEVQTLAASFKARRAELDKVTRPTAVAGN
ncbi:MAG TPA: hypothetical protein VNA22_06335 [Pyrinomonadaceae bacterium]|nr:hypothetical protein [Pyrinomonadaceae bacterium]